MKIKLFDEINDSIIEVICQESDRLDNALRQYGHQYSIRDYYIDDTHCMLNECVPYIVRDNKIVWNVRYEELTFNDLLNTFPEIQNNGLSFDVGFPAAGGPGAIICKLSVSAVTKFIGLKSPELGFASELAVDLNEAINGLSEYYEDKQISVVQSLEAIISTGETSELAIREILDFDQYHAGKLLRALKFVRDSETGRYHIKPTDRALAKLQVKELSINEMYYIQDEKL